MEEAGAKKKLKIMSWRENLKRIKTYVRCKFTVTVEAVPENGGFKTLEDAPYICSIFFFGRFHNFHPAIPEISKEDLAAYQVSQKEMSEAANTI